MKIPLYRHFQNKVYKRAMSVTGGEVPEAEICTVNPDVVGGAEEITRALNSLPALVEALYAAPEPVNNPSEEYINMWSDWYYTTRRNALAKDE